MRTRIAVCLAIVFLAQALLGGFAPAMADAQDHYDAFGNPLCITSGDHFDGNPAGGGTHHLAQCCTLGCMASAGALAMPPDRAPITLRRAPAAARFVAQYRTSPLIALDHNPARPRAPPAGT